MRTLGLNKKLKWLNKLCNWMCEYITGKIISMSVYKTISDGLEKFDEERWYSNNHKGLTA